MTCCNIPRWLRDGKTNFFYQYWFEMHMYIYIQINSTWLRLLFFNPPFFTHSPTHLCTHKHTHTHTETFPFALWARQQLCLVQVEEQLMNQTERLTIHICWHSPAAASKLAFATLPRPRPKARVNTWERSYRHTHTFRHIDTNMPIFFKNWNNLQLYQKARVWFQNKWGCRH